MSDNLETKASWIDPRSGLSSACRGWVILVAACLSRAVWADPVQLQPRTEITNSGGVIDVGGYAIPCVADWNGDGKKDLLVGYQTDGKIRLYLNIGTDGTPVFGEFTILQAGGIDIQHTSSGCGAPAPWVCDYDGDGRQDILVGAGGTGWVWFYRNTNSTVGAPFLAPGVSVLNGTTGLGSRATPYVHDWDEDGLPDLLCGDPNGYVWLYRNTNTVQTPLYASRMQIKGGDVNLNLGVRSVVRVFDWDGDGKKDLVCSSDAGVYWCRNTNSNVSPSLNAPVNLQAPSASGTLMNIQTGGRMRLELVDWNNDGVMDLVLGNLDGTLALFEGYRFKLAKLEVLFPGKCALQWKSARYLQYNVYAGPTPTSITTKVGTAIPSEGGITCWTNVSGDSQQFYRVQIAP